ncbi:MAG: PrpR N-terminal domain-containing protein [Lachnospiraceae bacterium]|nr:PrpR N-terminal domain-containing protein [Lachnospiraceae bacterium]
MEKVKILAIVPYEELREDILQASKAFDNLNIQVVVGTMDAGLKFAVEGQRAGYDVIISRGGTAEMIEEHVSIPVINIPVSSYDYISLIEQVGRNSVKTAIIGYANVTENAHAVKILSNTKLDIFTIMNPKEISPLLQEMKQQGFEVIIGDVVTIEFSKILGMKGILMKSGIESARKAIATAIKINGYMKRQNDMGVNSMHENRMEIVYDGSKTLEEFEIEIIKHVLERENGNLARATKILGISRSTIWRKLKM